MQRVTKSPIVIIQHLTYNYTVRGQHGTNICIQLSSLFVFFLVNFITNAHVMGIHFYVCDSVWYVCILFDTDLYCICYIYIYVRIYHV